MISGLGVETPCRNTDPCIVMASEFEQSGPDVACGAVPPLITAPSLTSEMEVAERQQRL